MFGIENKQSLLSLLFIVVCSTFSPEKSVAQDRCGPILNGSSKISVKIQDVLWTLKNLNKRLLQHIRPTYASGAKLVELDDIAFVLYRNSVRTGVEWAIFEALNAKGKVLFHSGGIKGRAMDEVETGPALFDLVAFLLTSELTDQVVAVRRRHTHPTSLNHEMPNKFSKADVMSDLDAKAALDFVFPGKFEFISQIIFKITGMIDVMEYKIPATHTALNGDFASPIFNTARRDYGLSALRDPDFVEPRKVFLKIGRLGNIQLGDDDASVIAMSLVKP